MDWGQFLAVQYVAISLVVFLWDKKSTVKHTQFLLPGALQGTLDKELPAACQSPLPPMRLFGVHLFVSLRAVLGVLRNSVCRI